MRLRRPLRREVIGQSECPILHRWTLLDRGSWKLMLHHFLPTSRDRDYHDHPRPFWTFVLRGEYLDIAVVAVGEYSTQIYPERMRAGTLRYRPARHTHTTMAGPRGAWTLVLIPHGHAVRAAGVPGARLRDRRCGDPLPNRSVGAVALPGGVGAACATAGS